MNWLLILLALLLYMMAVLVTGMQPRHSALSAFELRRRKKAEGIASLDSQRATQYEAVSACLRVVAVVLLLGAALLAVQLGGWMVGTLVAVACVLVHVRIADTRFVEKGSRAVYRKLEPKALRIMKEKAKWLRWLYKPGARSASQSAPTLASREELAHLIGSSKGILSKEDKQLLSASLSFNDQRVADHLTPRAEVPTIDQNELLGPLVLHELHETGSRQFLVINETIDQVRGILHLQDVVSLTTHHSTKAHKLMQTSVCYVHESQTLPEALAALLETQQPLCVVVSDEQQTVGVLTLEQVLEALFGRTLQDTFHEHDNVRAVAARRSTK